MFVAVTMQQMEMILRETFAAGLFSGGFRWLPGSDLSDRFLLTAATGTHRIDRSITGDGAARFRQIVRSALTPNDPDALHALDLVGG